MKKSKQEILAEDGYCEIHWYNRGHITRLWRLPTPPKGIPGVIEGLIGDYDRAVVIPLNKKPLPWHLLARIQAMPKVSVEMPQ